MNRLYCDQHLHTSFSSDSDAEPEVQARKAILLGMPGICITDHQDFDYPPGELSFLFDTKDYFQKLTHLKKELETEIHISVGVELGLQPHLGEKLTEYVTSWPFDFIIGSTHLVQDTDPYDGYLFENRTDEEAFRLYFEEVYQNLLAFHDFDSLGHLDYVVRYGRNRESEYDWTLFQDVIDEILKYIIRKDICLECNTAGFKGSGKHPNPTEGILRRYRELGGIGLTIGSDAHEPQYLGFCFEKTGTLLKQCGFHEYTVFENRKPKQLPL